MAFTFTIFGYLGAKLRGGSSPDPSSPRPVQWHDNSPDVELQQYVQQGQDTSSQSANKSNVEDSWQSISNVPVRLVPWKYPNFAESDQEERESGIKPVNRLR